MKDNSVYSEISSVRIINAENKDINNKDLQAYGVKVGDIYEAEVYYLSRNGKPTTARLNMGYGETIVAFSSEFEVIED